MLLHNLFGDSIVELSAQYLKEVKFFLALCPFKLDLVEKT